MNYRFSLINSIAVLLFFGCSGIVPDHKTIRLGHGMNTTHPVHSAMVVMAELIEEYSNGELRVVIYPNQQLGTERELLELMQIGSIDVTKVSSAVLENFVPQMRVFSLPFLFRDAEHTYNVLNGEIGRELLLSGEPYLLRGLTYYDAGTRSFYTKDRSIDTPSDLQGLRIRVMESQMAVNMMHALNSAPTVISFGELYTALQQGVVDGAENNLPSFYTTRHYEVARHFSFSEHLMLPDLLLIGTSTWGSLTEQERDWIQLAADSSAVYQYKIWAAAEETALNNIREDGVQISFPDKESFFELTYPMHEQFRTTDPVFYDLIQRIRDTE